MRTNAPDVDAPRGQMPALLSVVAGQLEKHITAALSGDALQDMEEFCVLYRTKGMEKEVRQRIASFQDRTEIVGL